jgi:hypothetical protein
VCWNVAVARPTVNARLARSGRARRSTSDLSRRLWAWTVCRRVVLGAGLVAAVPVIASVARGLSEGWTPYDDRGLGAVRAYDVFSTHPPLVGTLAAYSLPDRPSYSPGPLHFWLFAIPAHIGPAAFVVVAGLVNVLAVVAVVALAERRGGRAFMFVTAVAVALMSGSLVTEALHDTWEPYISVLPFTLVVFLCWSIACGEHRLLPVTVLVASFVLQCHIAYLPALAGLLAIAVFGLLRSRRRAASPPPLRRTLVGSAIVGLACWSAPLADQAVHRPGNLVNLGWYAFHRGATVGPDIGWRALVRVLGIPPWWLRARHGIAGHFQDLLAPPATFAVVSCIVILVALAAVLAWAVRTRDMQLGAAAAIALVLCGSIVLVTASTPKRNALAVTLGYTIDWGSAVGMWAWLTLAFAAMRTHRLRLPAVRASPVAGAAAVVAAAAFVAATGSADPDAPEFPQMRSVAQRVESAVRGARAVQVEYRWTWISYEFTMATVYTLRRHGLRPLVPALASEIGRYYDPRKGPRPDRFVFIQEAPPGPATAGTIRIPERTSASPRDILVTVTRTPLAAPGGAGGGALSRPSPPRPG